MTRKLFKIALISMAMLLGGIANAKTSPDYRAGYSDGCSSAKGRYTRSVYKYKHSVSYKNGWKKGKRACAKRYTSKKRIKKRVPVKRRTGSCNNEVPWVAFQKGWDDGLAAAKRGSTKEPRGCASYRHGWMSGYRSCKCSSQRRADSYIEGYYGGCASSASEFIMQNESYYSSSPAYRRGWDLGFSDCPTLSE